MKINFCPQKYIHFTGRDDVRRKSDEFSDSFVKFARKSKLDISDVRQFTQGYVPELKVKRKALKSNSEEDIAGEYSPMFHYSVNQKKFGLRDQLLLLRPRNRYYLPKSEYVRSVAHEMTHVFQSMDDEMSDVNFYDKHLRFSSQEEANKIIIALSNAWEYLENTVLYDSMDLFNKTSYLNNGIFPFKIEVNDNLMKQVINQKMAKISQTFPKLDMNLFKRFAKLHCQAEADAYRAGQSAVRQFRGELPQPQDETIPKLYEAVCRNIVLS